MGFSSQNYKEDDGECYGELVIGYRLLRQAKRCGDGLPVVCDNPLFYQIWVKPQWVFACGQISKAQGV